MKRKPIDKVMERTKNINGCIVWQGCIVRGYGQIGIKYKRIYVHRLVYESIKGKVPHGLVLDHLCRNRACVNVNHLEPVTCKENILRGFGVTALNKRKKLCKRGHELVGDNIYHAKKGRECKTCKKMLEKRWNKIRKVLRLK